MNELIRIGQIVEFDKLHNRLIYVALATDGLVKIGVTKDYSKREKDLNNTEHGEIVKYFETGRCVNSFEVEKAIHKQMKKYQHFGEWYKADFNYAVCVAKELFSKMAIVKREKPQSNAEYKCDSLLDYFHRNEVRIN